MQIYLHMQMHMNNEYEYTYADACVYTVMAAHIYICIFHHMSMYLRIFGYINIQKHPEPETLLVKAPF